MQIKQQEEEFDELGAIFSFPHTAVNARAEIPQRDGFPMIYNGMYGEFAYKNKIN